MQLILLLSAIMAALSGVSGRVAAPQQIESASSASVAAIAAEPATIVLAIAGIVFALALRIVPLPRPLAFVRTIAIYQERRRE